MSKYAYIYKGMNSLHWQSDSSVQFYDTNPSQSNTGYIRRFMKYDEIIDSNITLNFAGKKTGDVSFGLMMGAFDLGGKLMPWNETTGYKLTIKPDGSGTVNKYNYKDYGVVATFPAGTIKSGQQYRMQFATLKVSGGVNVLWRVDGKEVVNYFDNKEPVRSNGYFMCIDNITKQTPTSVNGETKTIFAPVDVDPNNPIIINIPTPSPEKSNQNSVYSSSVETGDKNNPGNARDGRNDTRWASGSMVKSNGVTESGNSYDWLEFDLGMEKEISGAEILFEAAHSVDFQIMVTRDASIFGKYKNYKLTGDTFPSINTISNGWTVVKTITGNKDLNFKTNFDKIKARYVRILSTKAADFGTTTYGNSIYEVKMVGE